jgi:hypothetical protein
MKELPDGTPGVVVDLQPDSILVFQSEHELTPTQLDHIRGQLSHDLPGRKCLILSRMRVIVINPPKDGGEE